MKRWQCCVLFLTLPCLPNVPYWYSLQIRRMSIPQLKSVATEKVNDTKLFSTWQASCSSFVSFALSFEGPLMFQIIERITFLRSQNWETERERESIEFESLPFKDVTVVKIVSLKLIQWDQDKEDDKKKKNPCIYMSAWSCHLSQ